jgi:D-serine deaminase-like pyridoxal phosphate-dependent protein
MAMTPARQALYNIKHNATVRFDNNYSWRKLAIMQTIHDLETPSILIDLDIMQRNLEAMQKRCDDLGIQFRPHIKTHKIPAIAKMQLAVGAVGIACQKVSEAEVFVDAGITDIQIPYNIVGERKTARLAELAKRAKVTVTVDNSTVIDGIAAAAKNAGVTINMLVELVALNNRTGTTPENALELAKHIVSYGDCLHFGGIMIYPADVAIRPRLQKTISLLSEAGIPVETVSGGGSGAILESHLVPELTEMRVGTYVFWDWGSVKKEWATFDDCAMKIRVTVVSANEPNRVIVDGGSKTVNAETLDGCYGYIVEYPNARLHKVNEEHGYVDFSAYDTMPKVGDILHIIPVHTCVVTNLHNRIYGVRGENIEQVWDVTARGLVW